MLVFTNLALIYISRTFVFIQSEKMKMHADSCLATKYKVWMKSNASGVISQPQMAVLTCSSASVLSHQLQKVSMRKYCVAAVSTQCILSSIEFSLVKVIPPIENQYQTLTFL